MSSTTRGTVEPTDDFFATPDWATDIIIPHLRVPTTVLEPCAGDGAMMRRLEKAWPHADVVGIELDEARAEETAVRLRCVQGDFLIYDIRGSYDLIATNPPFSIAQQIVERALSVIRPGGEVAMLLRLAFLETAKRVAFHKKYPSDVHVFAKRPSFKSDGATDSAAYAWFLFGEGHACRRWSILEPPARAS